MAWMGKAVEDGEDEVSSRRYRQNVEKRGGRARGIEVC